MPGDDLLTNAEHTTRDKGNDFSPDMLPARIISA
jgi:hypothetical protein